MRFEVMAWRGRVIGSWKVLRDGSWDDVLPLGELEMAPDLHGLIRSEERDFPVGTKLARFDRAPGAGIEQVEIYEVCSSYAGERYREFMRDFDSFEDAEDWGLERFGKKVGGLKS